MDYHVFKSAINGCLSPYIGGSQRPVFFDIAREYPELDLVTQSYPEIRREFEGLLDSDPHLPAYHEIDKGETEISATTAEKWNVCMLEVLGHRLESNCERFPETCRAIDQVSNRIQAFFSILDPGKSVPMHEGPYYGYLRYHLGLRVPNDSAPRIEVNGQPYTWKEGEAVLFDDSWPHEVINNSKEMRAVLIIDVARPMPYLPTMLNRATQMVARHTYGKSVAEKARQFSRRAA